MIGADLLVQGGDHLRARIPATRGVILLRGVDDPHHHRLHDVMTSLGAEVPFRQLVAEGIEVRLRLLVASRTGGIRRHPHVVGTVEIAGITVNDAGAIAAIVGAAGKGAERHQGEATETSMAGMERALVEGDFD